MFLSRYEHLQTQLKAGHLENYRTRQHPSALVVFSKPLDLCIYHAINFMCFQRDHHLASAARTGRKSTKYKRGAEAVWPPRVEGALLEGMPICGFFLHYYSLTPLRPFVGLEQYFPPPTSSSSRHQRKFQRFPQRNKIISKHILNNTGVYRTAKQVGSRLQQLSETSTDAYSKTRLLESLNSHSRCFSSLSHQG